MARKVAMFNSKVKFHNNKKMFANPQRGKDLTIEREKLFVLIKKKYPETEPDDFLGKIDTSSRAIQPITNYEKLAKLIICEQEKKHGS